MLRFYFFLCFVCSSCILSARVHYVNYAATGLNNGTSWRNAFKSPLDALKVATDGDEIWIARGTYNAHRGYKQYHFYLKSGVSLYGGFLGSEQFLQERDPVKYRTILKSYVVTGQSGHVWDTVYQNVLYCEDTNENTAIDGFIITKGEATARLAAPEQCVDSVRVGCNGGGIYIYSSALSHPTSLQIRNCAFIDNRAQYGGGISANYSDGTGRLIIKNCRFERNWNNDVGGGISVATGYQGAPYVEIDSCLFRGNTGWVGSGLSLYNLSPNGRMVVRNCLFEENQASITGAGGQVANWSGRGREQIIVENCLFDRNIGYSSIYPRTGHGGGLFVVGSTIRNCIFDRNVAADGGAISGGSYNVFNNIISNNQAYIAGGAFAGFDLLNIVGNTIVNNTARSMGGVFTNLQKGRCNFINNIFWGNRGLKGGNMLDSLTSFKFYFANCVISEPDCAAMESNLHPMYDSLFCGPHLYFQLDPHFRDTVHGDYRLSSCSPLLDLGSGEWTEQLGVETDYAGNARIIDDAPDIGAWEIERSVPEPFFFVQNASGPLNADGSAYVISVAGGEMPYRFQWSNGSNTDSARMLLPDIYRVVVTDAQGCTGTGLVQVSHTSGTRASPVSDVHFRVSPNPVKDYVYVSTESPAGFRPFTWHLYDLHGREMRSWEISSAHQRIDLRDLAGGMWLWQARQGGIKSGQGRVMVVRR